MKRGERTTSTKTVGPAGIAGMRPVMPLALQTFLDQERTSRTRTTIPYAVSGRGSQAGQRDRDKPFDRRP